MSARYRGAVVSWDDDRGNGWIELPTGQRVHALFAAIERELPGYKSLTVGDIVTFAAIGDSLERDYVQAEDIRVEPTVGQKAAKRLNRRAAKAYGKPVGADSAHAVSAKRGSSQK